jgi:hypothetical protein
MSSSKTILKKVTRRRGSVSLTNVRRAVNTVLAQNIAGQSNPSSGRVKKVRQQARVAYTH